MQQIFGRIGLWALAVAGWLFLPLDPASAQGCGGGPLSTSTGNIVGSVLGAAAGGLIGNQIGHGSGKGVATGLGVVGGALAGGYVGRSAEGCNAASRPGAAPSAYRPAAARGTPTCHFVLTQGEIDGQAQQITGVACLEPDGTWQMASDRGAERAAEADLVVRAQQQLRQQGFYVRDNVDGVWGPATSGAVRNFQRANGLAESGRLDAPTQTALGIAPAPLAVTPATATAPAAPATPAAPAPANPAGNAGAAPIQVNAGP